MARILAVLALLTITLVAVEAAAGEACTCSPGSEAARITAHLDRVERVLRSRNVDHLAEAQRVARKKHLDVLRAYIDRGLFPENHSHLGQRIPFFVDRHGVHCAVAYLIARSGRGDLVEAVREGFNEAYLPAMDVEGLDEWIAGSGLSADELSLIQPDYCGGCYDDDPYDCFYRYCTPNDPMSMNNHCGTFTSADGSSCGDPDDLCRTAGTCESGSCKDEPVVCDDGDSNTDDTCEPERGCVFTPRPDEPSSETVEGCATAGDREASWLAMAVFALALGRRRGARRS